MIKSVVTGLLGGGKREALSERQLSRGDDRQEGRQMRAVSSFVSKGERVAGLCSESYSSDQHPDDCAAGELT